MKDIIDSIKKNAWMWLFLLCFGYGLGKQLTYINIVSDCQVLGMFRLGDRPFDCRMSKVPA